MNFISIHSNTESPISEFSKIICDKLSEYSIFDCTKVEKIYNYNKGCSIDCGYMTSMKIFDKLIQILENHKDVKSKYFTVMLYEQSGTLIERAIHYPVYDICNKDPIIDNEMEKWNSMRSTKFSNEVKLEPNADDNRTIG